MTLTWRARRRMPALLQRLLLRSRRMPLRRMRPLLPFSLAALAPGIALATALAPGALPTGAQVVAGQAAITQAANRMNIAQGTDRAIINWNSFNIGSQAAVNIQMPSATSASLNRVLSTDPSTLLGTLTSNGRVWLVNPAGILVGAGARIDVGGFIASALNIRDEDFLANRFAFTQGGLGGKVENQGSITTPSGGMVYLVGPAVENSGIINAPNGEVLLAAGQSVQLADTNTPGVKIEVTGSDGSATNLGQILADAGRIGLGGALVKNGGQISASSVERDGGRVFLRATKSVATEASSTLSADGKRGGQVVVYAEDAADIGGHISARGSAGKGGFVETSGRGSLNVANLPDIGAGGEWLIDPTNISIVSNGVGANIGISTPDAANQIITSTGASAIVLTSTIETALNAGTNVRIATGAAGGEAGDITISGTISKSSSPIITLPALPEPVPTLTLEAHHDIIFSGGSITSTSNKLNLVLSPNQANAARSDAGSVKLNNSRIALNGGQLTLNGDMSMDSSSLASLSMSTTGTLSLVGGTNVIDANLTLPGMALSFGTLRGTGKLTVTDFAWSGGVIKGTAGDSAYDITNLSLSGITTLDGRVVNLVQNGHSTTAAGDYTSLTLTNGAVLNNAGTLALNGYGDAIGDFDYYYYTGRSQINNLATGRIVSNGAAGTINRIGTATYDGEVASGVDFNNAGAVEVNGGALRIRGGGSHTGSFAVNAGTLNETTELSFGAAQGSPVDIASAFAQNASNGGKAVITFNDGGDDRSGSVVNINAGTTLVQNLGQNSSAVVAFNKIAPYYSLDGSSLSASDIVTNLNVYLNLAEATLSDGYLLGTGKLTATNFAWSGGTIGGDGSAGLLNPAHQFTNLALSGDAYLDGRTINLAAGGHSSTELNGYTTLYMDNGAVLNNRGTLTLQGAQDTLGLANAYYSSAVGGTINNTGRIISTRSAANNDGYQYPNQIGSYYFGEGGGLASVAFNNLAGGKVEVRSDGVDEGNHAIAGGLNIRGPGSHAGSFEVSATNGAVSTLSFGSGSGSTIDIGASFTQSAGANSKTVIAFNDGSYYGYYDYGGTVNINAGTTMTATAGAGGSNSVSFGGYQDYYDYYGFLGNQVTNLNTSLTLADASLEGGVLQGSGKLTATNFAWSGGAIKGTSGVPAYDIANLALSGYTFLDGRTLNLVAGGNSSTAAGGYTELALANGAVLNNAGTLSLKGTSNVIGRAGYQYSDYLSEDTVMVSAVGSRIVNAAGGTIVTNALGNGGYTQIGDHVSVDGGVDAVAFQNHGTVNMMGGMLQIMGDNADSAPTVVNQGAIAFARSGFFKTAGAFVNAGSFGGAGYVMADSFTNNGFLAPGAAATPGTLKIVGSFTQGAGGVLAMRLGGTGSGQADKLDVAGHAVTLGGTLNLSTVDGYVPASGDSIPLILGDRVGATTFASIVRPDGMVLGYGLSTGEVARIGHIVGGKYFTNANANLSWSDAGNWSGGVLPGYLDGVVIDTGPGTMVTYDGSGIAGGATSIATLRVNAANGLDLTGGSLTVAGATSIDGVLRLNGGSFSSLGALTNTGSIAVNSGSFSALGGGTHAGGFTLNGGSASLGGATSFSSLSVTGGSLQSTGSVGVDGVFDQTAGGSINVGANSLSIRQAGDLTLGGITAGSLTLASGGAIAQHAGSAISAGELEAQAAGGIALAGSGNQIGRFSAANTGSGDITLATGGALDLGYIDNGARKVVVRAGGMLTEQNGGVSAGLLDARASGGITLDGANRLHELKAENLAAGGASAVSVVNVSGPAKLRLSGIVSQAGDVLIDDTGGIVNTGPITAAGRVSLTAHSPIDSSGAILAGGDVTLAAMSSAAGNDSITISGSISSLTGGIALSAGTNVTLDPAASLSVASGNQVLLRALTGAVTYNPAQISGALATVSQPGAPVPGTPLTGVLPYTRSVADSTVLMADLLAPTRQFGASPASSVMPVVAGNGHFNTAADYGSTHTVGGTANNFGSVAGEEPARSSDDPKQDAQFGLPRAANRGLPVCN
ncbi:filamentous hemagglutinin family N-terminal domain-containing protein [Noviherbaspirillum humi]|uniref:Filamentous hemagglutinin family N-terminal domain-containing protein n=1 Tax=Noviherbaspirillum humi TaxID=1688639 RepID=A0A239J4R0_9BURK|nr:filamentous hemagglutinin N-terminal domain-containing protein [Noviherbaspirillum humi]SNS99634.1 filamentous hemagglutinin family N-terminal domain-containing protein [Noviherbaspirillum humi]